MKKHLKDLDTVSITDTINKYGKGKMKLILEVFSRSISTMNNLDKISTGEMFRAQKNLIQRFKTSRLSKKWSFKYVLINLQDYIIKNGGKI